MKNALIIFAKNPKLGKVKTRLAKTIGDEAALKIYKDFMKLIKNECTEVDADVHLFYGSNIEIEDIWEDLKITKHVQLHVNNLGKRMVAAFKKVKKMGYENICIIGVDCPYITSDLLNISFSQLTENDIVIGPAKDGGFYLLGIKDLAHLDFSNIKWSTDSVLNTYLNNLNQLQVRINYIEILEDIDEINALKRYQIHLNSMNNNNL